MLRGRTASCFLVFAVLAGCGDDGGGPGEPRPCATDADCADGVFCNGTERCLPGDPNANAFGCVGGEPPCAAGSACIETDDTCDAVCATPDGDGDGADRVACGGSDCDDEDSNRFPGNPELCDEGHDEDCDPLTVGVVDLDGDGFIDATCRNEGGAVGSDCDDRDARVGPLRIEQCNGRDDDCDGNVDEEVAIDGFVDVDADGRGDSARQLRACADAAHFAAVGEDCDDADLSVQPAQNELCDGKDNDCDGAIDEHAGEVYWYPDADGDGYGELDGDPILSCDPVAGRSVLPTDCDDGAAGVSPAAPETCNGVDDDCNGAADFLGPGGDLEDDDRDGVPDVSCGGTDCDDRDPFAAPGFPELCNERDDDCDGMVDEGATESDWYVDLDGDSWGTGTAVRMCAPGSGFAPRAGDCDDTSADVVPGAEELCDGVDDDCDGTIDEGASARCGGPNARYACVSGRCVIASCAGGFGDCDLRNPNGCETALGSSAEHCGLCYAACDGTCTDGSCSTAPPPWSLSVLSFDADAFDLVAVDGGRIATLTVSPTREWLTDPAGEALVELPLRTWIVAAGAGHYPTAAEADAASVLGSLFTVDVGTDAYGVLPIPLESLLPLGAQRTSRGVVAVRNTGATITGGSIPVSLDLPNGGGMGAPYSPFAPIELTGDAAFDPGRDLVIFGDVAPGPVRVNAVGCTLRSQDPVVYAGMATAISVECPSTPVEL